MTRSSVSDWSRTSLNSPDPVQHDRLSSTADSTGRCKRPKPAIKQPFAICRRVRIGQIRKPSTLRGSFSSCGHVLRCVPCTVPDDPERIARLRLIGRPPTWLTAASDRRVRSGINMALQGGHGRSAEEIMCGNGKCAGGGGQSTRVPPFRMTTFQRGSPDEHICNALLALGNVFPRAWIPA